MVAKLNRMQVQRKLKHLGLGVFTPREFQGIFNVPKKTALTFISRNVKSGLFLKLRNNYYQLQDNYVSAYTIANKIYQPSYVSLETALSYYGIIPETIYAVTSITTKSTKEFETPKTVFIYRKIKLRGFTGYRATRLEGVVVLFAEAEKALADYLYFVDLKKIALNDRLELRNINRTKLVKYVKLFNRSSLLKLVDHIYAEYRKPQRIY